MAEGGQAAGRGSRQPHTPTSTTSAAPLATVSATKPSGIENLVQLQPCYDISDIDFKEKIGHGSYGVVYKAVWQNRLVAVKEFIANAEQKAIETEVKQLSRVVHPNIIALYGVSTHNQCKYLIMEYAEGGSLHNFLHGKAKPYYSAAHAMSWARQCAEGVAYLHAMKPKPLIHRDLKPLNLLLSNKGRNLKICDFGTVVDKSTKMTNNKGSAAWMAPEVFEGSNYTEKCDIFSWGIVLWEVLSRRQPFKEVDNTYSIMWKIHKGERPPLIEGCPPPIQKLMTSCWATAPEVRPSMQYVLYVMNALSEFFPGADEPLEYEFINQQVKQPESADTIDNCDFTFSDCSSDNLTTSTQITSTNNHSAPLITTCESNLGNCDVYGNNLNTLRLAKYPIRSSPSPLPTSRWDVIPEEQDKYDEGTNSGLSGKDLLRLTSSTDTMSRVETIRNGLLNMACVPMIPLSIDVDPNAWEFSHEGTPAGSYQEKDISKSDGKERLTVTADPKPMIPNDVDHQNTTSAVLRTTPATNTDNVDYEEDENDADDQSLHEMLDAELQPEPPIPNNQQSQEIYEEHRRLAKEYLRVDTKLYYARDLRDKCLASLETPEREQKQELLAKMSEKEELLDLYNNLKQQLERMRTTQRKPTTTTTTTVNTTTNNSASCSAESSTNRPLTGTDSGAANDIVSEDGWVVISPNQQNS